MLYRSRTHLDRLFEHETRVDSLKKKGDETEDSSFHRIVIDHPTPLSSDSSSTSSMSPESSSYRYNRNEDDTTDNNSCIRNSSSSMSSTPSIPIPQQPSVAIRRRPISSSASSHTHENGDLNHADDSVEQKRYDSSTWNMYYRIQAHRRTKEHEASVTRQETIPSMVVLNSNVSATPTSHVRCDVDPKYPSSPVCFQSNNDLGYYDDDKDTNKTNDVNDESELGIFDLEI